VAGGWATGANFTTPIAANSTAAIIPAGSQNTFGANSDDGASTISGIVGNRTQGATCLTSGFVAGV